VVDVVVGEDGDDVVPAVAAVASDFARPEPPVEGAPDDAAPYPESVAEEAPPSRRERRRAKRRERRLARGRRLITFRTLLFVVLVAAVIAGALYAVRWYDVNSYFVRADNNELVIYQGRIGGFLWYQPKVVERTGVTTADVPATYRSDLIAGVEETSVADARTYVSNLQNAMQSEQPGSSPVSPTTSPSSTVVTTTTKGA
jgi:PPM family protein phosphatase